MSHLPPMLLTPVLMAAESAVNRALQLDPVARARLPQLTGQVFRVNAPPFAVTVQFLADSVQLTRNTELTPTASLTGSPGLMISAIRADSDLVPDGLLIEGDLAAVQIARVLIRDLAPDWEAALAELVGDVAAHAIGKQLRSLIGWTRSTGSTLLGTAGEYLSEERDMFASRSAVTQFGATVSDTRQHVDALQDRLDKLDELLHKLTDTKRNA